VGRSPKIMQPFGDRSKSLLSRMLTRSSGSSRPRKLWQPAIDRRAQWVMSQILREQDKKVYFHWLKEHRHLGHLGQLWCGAPPISGLGFDDEGKEYCAATKPKSRSNGHLVKPDAATRRCARHVVLFRSLADRQLGWPEANGRALAK